MQYLGVFFSVAGAVFLLYVFFVAGVAHHTHTHIHINRTLADFFPDTLLTSGGFHPKLIYETNFAIFFGVFHFSFLLAVPIIFQKNIFKHFDNPPSRPQNTMKFMSRTPQFFFEIHPKISYNHFRVII